MLVRPLDIERLLNLDELLLQLVKLLLEFVVLSDEAADLLEVKVCLDECVLSEGTLSAY